MEGFINYFKEFWPLFIVLFVLLVALIFMFRKASKTLQKAKAEKEKLIKKLDHMKLIRETYSELSEEKILSDDGENLLEGVTDNIQVRLEKSPDMNTAFFELSEEEKIVYAYFFFLDESVVNPSEFFKQYSKPLTPYALKGCEMFLSKEALSLVKNLYNSYDEDNESESVIPEKIDSLDEKIKALLDVKTEKLKAADFIKKNAQKFI